MGRLDVKAGDEVYLVWNALERPPRKVKVAKVGRSLVHIYDYEGSDRTTPYRIEGGRASDGYGRSRIMTQKMVDDREARQALHRRLVGAGWREVSNVRGMSNLSVDDMRRVVDLFEELKR